MGGVGRPLGGYRCENVPAGGVAFILPPQAVGPARLATLGFSVVFLSMTVGFTMILLTQVGLGALLVAGLFLLLFFAAGVVMFWFGLLAALGDHDRIELDARELRVVKQAGPIRRTRRMPIDQIESITVPDGREPPATPTDPTQPDAPRHEGSTQQQLTAVIASQPGLAFDLSQAKLNIKLHEEKDFTAAAGDAFSLRLLAAGLNQQLAHARGGEMPTIPLHASLAPASPEGPIPDPHAPLPDPPADTDTQVQRAPDGGRVTLRIPPIGLRGTPAQQALARFTLTFGGMILGATAIGLGIAYLLRDQLHKAPVGIWLFAVPVMAALWVGAIACLADWLGAARQRAILDIAEGTLLVTRQGLLKRIQWSCPRDKLLQVLAHRTGDSISERRVVTTSFTGPEQLGAPEITEIHALYILPSDPAVPRVEMLHGRDPGELKWIAKTLRAALDLSDP